MVRVDGGVLEVERERQSGGWDSLVLVLGGCWCCWLADWGLARACPALGKSTNEERTDSGDRH